MKLTLRDGTYYSESKFHGQKCVTPSDCGKHGWKNDELCNELSSRMANEINWLSEVVLALLNLPDDSPSKKDAIKDYLDFQKCQLHKDEMLAKIHRQRLIEDIKSKYLGGE